MSGNNFVLDTNIILYILNGNKKLAEMLDGKHVFVSFITELELLGYSGISMKDKSLIRAFLDDCVVIGMNDPIKDNTLKIKQNQTVKLPDAIIAATAMFLDIPLVSADKGFLKIKGLNLVFFEQ